MHVLSLSSQLEWIGSDAFIDSGLQKICIPDSVRWIDDGCFKDSQLESVVFGESSMLEHLGAGAFGGTKIVEIVIPPRVREICDHCFASCVDLRRVSFSVHSSIEFIGVEARHALKTFVFLPV